MRQKTKRREKTIDSDTNRRQREKGEREEEVKRMNGSAAIDELVARGKSIKNKHCTGE